MRLWQATVLVAITLGILHLGVQGADTNTPLRVALVSSETGPEASKLLDLSISKLSKNRNFILLGRISIEHVLAEQKQAFSGLVEAVRTKQVSILTSSRGTGEGSPLDNEAPACIFHVSPDEARERIVFAAQERRDK